MKTLAYLLIGLFVAVAIQPVLAQLPICADATAPVIVSEKNTACSGQPVLLRASGCGSGTAVWNNGKEGATITVYPTKTTSYSVYCKQVACQSNNANTWTITVKTPQTPILSASAREVCFGQNVTLIASNCPNDEVIWSNGDKGKEITLNAIRTAVYSAVCKDSEGCISCFSNDLEIKVKPQGILPIVVPTSKICDGQSVTLSVSCNNPVQWSNGLVGNTLTVTPSVTTTYSAKCNSEGCGLAEGSVNIEVGKPLPPTIVGNTNFCIGETIKLQAQGCSSSVLWSNGARGATLTDKPTAAQTYTAICEHGDCRSEPSNVFTLTPKECPMLPTEILGLSKTLHSLTKISEKIFKVEYAIRISNTGKNDLTSIKIIDSLDKVFKNGVVIVDKPVVKVYADATIAKQIDWGIDTTFTGRQGNYTLTMPAMATLPVNSVRTVLMKLTIDLGNAKDSVFLNTAYAEAIDAQGNICKDISTSGISPDPDNDGDPSNNSEPTVLNAARTAIDLVDDVFVPEGFSPNGDGINDVLTITNKANINVHLEVYNRWGGLVYKNTEYKNDWNGTATMAKEPLPVGTYFYLIKLSDGRELSKFLTISR